MGFLRDQAIAGRLDEEELADRADKAYSARTWAELRALISDLPHEQGGWLSTSYAAKSPAPTRRKALRVALLALLGALLVAGALDQLAGNFSDEEIRRQTGGCPVAQRS